MTRIRPHAAPGFTLVEILTATAIMAVIVGFVMTIMTQVLDVWNSSSDELELSSQARAALDLLKQDLQQAIFRHDGSQWFVLTSEVPGQVGTWNQGVYSPLPVSPTTASRLMFFAPTATRETTDSANPPNQVFGDTCAIEYRMTFGPLFPVNTNGQPVLALHRAVLDPEVTMLGLNTQAGVLLSKTPSTSQTILAMGSTTMDLTSAWNTLDSATITGNGTDNPINIQNTVPENNSGNLSIYGGNTTATTIVYNVAQFLVTVNFYDTTQPSGISAYSYSAFRYGGSSTLNQLIPLVALGFPLLPTVSPTNSVVDDYTGTPAPPALPTSETNMPYPYNLAYADITLTLLTDEGATAFAQTQNKSALQTINTPQGGGTMGAWAQFLLQYGRTYTERVYFQNTPQ
jgi:prepilin-type N-terminal cleavage/methylation domain-containing protein